MIDGLAVKNIHVGGLFKQMARQQADAVTFTVNAQGKQVVGSRIFCQRSDALQGNGALRDQVDPLRVVIAGTSAVPLSKMANDGPP